MNTIYILIFLTFASPTSQTIIEWGHHGIYKSETACISYQQQLVDSLSATTYTACWEIDLNKENIYDGNE